MIRRLLQLVLALAAVLCAAASFASFPPVAGWDDSTCNQSVGFTPYHTDSHVTETWVCRPASNPDLLDCGYNLNSGYYGWSDWFYKMCSQTKKPASCPANSTLANGECSCAPGYVEQGGQCVNPNQQCQDKQGSTTIVNWTVGYTRTPDIDADPNWVLTGPPNVIPSDKQACYQGCKVSLGDATMAYQSASPTPTGLYRLSMDLTATHGGSSCTSGDSDGPLNPNQPIPPCPGFVGEVNGKLGCYGTAEKPARDDKPTPKPPAPIDKGNPAAGEKPATGDGSGNGGAGRTPTNGNGGPAGGPAGAAGGTKPDGQTDKPTDDKKEQQNCGAPGQPKCGIDESGTPSGRGAFDSSRDSLNANADKMMGGLDSIKNTSDKDTSWGVVPTWIDHGQCAPWDLGVMELPGKSIPLVVDICVIEPYVVGVTSFLWVVATFFLTIAMVFRVTTATAG